MLMHTRAFSNVLNELLIKIEGIYIRERERERERASFGPFHNRTFLSSRGSISLITWTYNCNA